MPIDIVILLFSFVVILVGAEFFTNGIEWFGRKLELAEGAVGSVLAAVGTALPETMIPIVAILFTVGEHTDEIGLGAILGAPFMLATLAMFVTGLAVLWQARRRPAGDRMPVDPRVLWMDMRTFAIAYAIAIGASFLPPEPTWPKLVVAAVLLVIYGWYVKSHFEADPEVDAVDLSPLRMHRIDRTAHRIDPSVPRLRIVNLQVVAAIALIIGGAVAFVGAVERIASSIGIAEVLVALILAPIATELPEKFNSVLWIRKGKDTLAMGNITGAMVFQAAIPTVVALVFAPQAWTFGPGTYIAFASAGIAFLSSAAIFIPMARRGVLRGRALLIGGIFYVGYLGIVAGSIVSGFL